LGARLRRCGVKRCHLVRVHEGCWLAPFVRSRRMSGATARSEAFLRTGGELVPSIYLQCNQALAGWDSSGQTHSRDGGFQKVTIDHKSAYFQLWLKHPTMQFRRCSNNEIFNFDPRCYWRSWAGGRHAGGGCWVRYTPGCRNPARANPAVETVRFDYADRSTIVPALDTRPF
jgi:hypothetical protein